MSQAGVHRHMWSVSADADGTGCTRQRAGAAAAAVAALDDAADGAQADRQVSPRIIYLFKHHVNSGT